MNIEIKNFGPIDYLKIDLDKDLHLIYGKNAVGKSYAIYTIYCLLKNIKEIDVFSNRRYIGSNIEEKIKTLMNGVKTNESKSNVRTLNITQIFTKLIKEAFRDLFLREFQNSLLNTFSSLDNLKNRFNNQEFQITINLHKNGKCKKIIFFKKKDGNLDVEIQLDLTKIELVEKSTKTTKYSIYIDGKMFVGKPSEIERNNILEGLLDNYIFGIFSELNTVMREIYFLPASRSGLYQGLNSFSAIIAELTKSRFLITNKKIELPSLSEPVADYYIDLSTVDKKHFNKEFSSLVGILEKKILKGKVEFDDETKNITYEPDGLELKLNLSEASSMVAEMSPLVLYLKHIINHKFKGNLEPRYPRNYYPLYWRQRKVREEDDILFIEEPEAHLHPEIQVELMKVFADMSKHKMKIFITSHSNYMFNELNNLILENKIDKERIAVYHLIHGENGTIQNPEMTVTEDGIYDENFQETSEKLYEERMRILEEAENAN
jgi:predicted ATPase